MSWQLQTAGVFRRVPKGSGSALLAVRTMRVNLAEGVADAGAPDTEQTQLDRELFRPCWVNMWGKTTRNRVAPTGLSALGAQSHDMTFGVFRTGSCSRPAWRLAMIPSVTSMK